MKDIDKLIEEAAENEYPLEVGYGASTRNNELQNAFEAGANFMKDKLYSEDEVKELYNSISDIRNEIRDKYDKNTNFPEYNSMKHQITGLDRSLSLFESWFEQNKKK